MFPCLLDRNGKMEANLNTVSIANSLLQGRLTAEEQDTISIHPRVTKIDFVAGEVNIPVEELHCCY